VMLNWFLLSNDLLIYSGNAVPCAYKGGAFVAFHGSSDRAPEPQGGYNVVFQPLADGKTAGPYIVFVDGLDGVRRRALHFGRCARPHLARHHHGNPEAPLASAPSR